jgi:hypothetical protein
MVRQSQLYLQETSSRCATRVIRGGAIARHAVAGLGPRRLPVVSTPGGSGRVRGSAQQPLFGATGLMGRRVAVRETKDKIEIQLDARRMVTHRRIPEAEHQRILLPEHRPARNQASQRPDPHPEEKTIVAALPELHEYVAALKQRSRKIVTLALRQLLRMVREYPPEPLVAAVHEAARYGLYDLDRLERMILRRVAREYFLLSEGPDAHD